MEQLNLYTEQQLEQPKPLTDKQLEALREFGYTEQEIESLATIK